MSVNWLNSVTPVADMFVKRAKLFYWRFVKQRRSALFTKMVRLVEMMVKHGAGGITLGAGGVCWLGADVFLGDSVPYRMLAGLV